MAWLRVLVIAAIFAATVAAKPAAPPGPDAATRAAIDSALSWLARNSHYSPTPVRSWVVLDAKDVAAHARNLHVADDPRMVFAMYSCSAHTLYFRRGADFSDPVVFSFLVHELTHHLQCESGRAESDLCAWEREAYGMQGAYLRAAIATGMNGKRLNAVQLTAARATAADLDRRTEIACADLGAVTRRRR